MTASRQTHPCLGCGAPVVSYLYERKLGKGKYCSSKCFGRSISTKLTRTCATCGSTFHPKPQQVRVGGWRFCSLKCRRHSGVKRRVPTKAELLAKDPTRLRSCEWCGRLYVGRRNATWQRFDTRTCSMAAWAHRNRPRTTPLPESVVEGKKRCARCCEVKTCEAFEPYKSGYRSYCRSCRRKDQRASGKRRSAKVRGATVLGPVNFERIYQRDKGRCHICRRRVAKSQVEYDHVFPVSRGGEHSERNIAVSHRTCNRRKHAKITTLF